MFRISTHFYDDLLNEIRNIPDQIMAIKHTWQSFQEGSQTSAIMWALENYLCTQDQECFVPEAFSHYPSTVMSNVSNLKGLWLS